MSPGSPRATPDCGPRSWPATPAAVRRCPRPAAGRPRRSSPALGRGGGDDRAATPGAPRGPGPDDHPWQRRPRPHPRQARRRPRGLRDGHGGRPGHAGRAGPPSRRRRRGSASTSRTCASTTASVSPSGSPRSRSCPGGGALRPSWRRGLAPGWRTRAPSLWWAPATSSGVRRDSGVEHASVGRRHRRAVRVRQVQRVQGGGPRAGPGLSRHRRDVPGGDLVVPGPGHRPRRPPQPWPPLPRGAAGRSAWTRPRRPSRSPDWTSRRRSAEPRIAVTGAVSKVATNLAVRAGAPATASGSSSPRSPRTTVGSSPRAVTSRPSSPRTPMCASC